MIPYNPSSFNTNKTILEQILELKNWLKAHPSYEIFYCTANFMPYQDVDYAFTEIAGGRAEEIEVGDLLVFPDAYYSQVIAVDHDTEFVTIALPATSFKGPQGATGPTGVSVATANIYPDGHLYLTLSDGTLIDTGIAKGADGINGTDGAYISSASVDASGDLQITIYDPATSTSSVVNAGHVVGADGQGIQIIDVTTTTGTLSASDLAKVTGTDDCTINYTSANGTISFKRLFWDSAYAYFTGVYVETDTYYCVTEVELVSGAFSIDINPLPIKDNNIDSGSATNGQVLTANGSGGATWQTPSGGSANVVTLNALTGTLTNDEYNTLLNENSIIDFYVSPNHKLYVKKQETATEMRFDYLDQYNYISRYTINKSTKAYSHSYLELTYTGISSVTATNGQVLTADGNGNATWQNAGGSSPEIVTIASATGTMSASDLTKLNDGAIIYKSDSSTYYIKQGKYGSPESYYYESISIYPTYVNHASLVINASTGVFSTSYTTIYTKTTASRIDSQSTTSGKVLTADGNGGASWQNAGGSQLYEHNIVLYKSGSFSISFRIINTTSTAMIQSDVGTYLANNSANNVYLVASGSIFISPSLYAIVSICLINGNLYTRYLNTSGNEAYVNQGTFSIMSINVKDNVITL